MGEFLDLIDMKVVVLAFTVIMLLFLIIVLVLSSKLKKLRKTYTNMLSGSENLNIEETLLALQAIASNLQAKADENQKQLNAVVQQMKKMKSNIGVYRYNAFAESGSDLSFSVALLDEEQDGVVLTGIHNRDETYVYAKPITQGQSNYTLSPEEKEAIHRGGQKK